MNTSPAPSFEIGEPADGRGALVSGSLSVLLHGSILAFLALSAWLAPEVVEEIIPVRIIREAPEPPPPQWRGASWSRAARSLAPVSPPPSRARERSRSPSHAP